MESKTTPSRFWGSPIYQRLPFTRWYFSLLTATSPPSSPIFQPPINTNLPFIIYNFAYKAPITLLRNTIRNHSDGMDKRCAHLSPVAISPLRTGAGLARSLLHRLGFLIAVICSVSIFILAHHDAPLEASCTRAGALQDTIAHSLSEPRSNCAFPALSQSAAPWECTVRNLIQLTGFINFKLLLLLIAVQWLRCWLGKENKHEPSFEQVSNPCCL